MKVAFQGERGAYSELAAIKYFGEKIHLIPYKTLVDVFYSVGDKADYAIIPIENSIEGSVNEACDLLAISDLKIVGEVYIKIEHVLISYPFNTINDIKKVYSHPQALAQCRRFINLHNLEAIPYYDTAGSVKMLSENLLKDSAAIASKRAAELYNMAVIAEDISDEKNNYTRFIVLGKNYTRPTKKDKTSIIFATKHEPGALYRALEEFAIRNINLTMIISRPIKGKPWEYNFYVDFEGHIEEDNIKDCLEGLKKRTTFLKILGSYPRADFQY